MSSNSKIATFIITEAKISSIFETVRFIEKVSSYEPLLKFLGIKFQSVKIIQSINTCKVFTYIIAEPKQFVLARIKYRF